MALNQMNSVGTSTLSSLKDLTANAPWLKHYTPRPSLAPDCEPCQGKGRTGYYPGAADAFSDGYVYCTCAEGVYWLAKATKEREAQLAARAAELQEVMQKRFSEFSRLHCKGASVPSIALMRPAPGVNEVREFGRNWNHKTSLLLTGHYGTGKTQAAVGLAADLMPGLLARFQTVRLVTAPDFLNELRNGYDDDHKPKEGYRDVLEDYRTCGLLVFDDIGAGKLTDWVKEQFYMLFDYRYRQELPTFATSNFTRNSFVEAVGDMRVVERIKETYVVIEFTGENQRTHEMARRLKIVK